MPCKAKPPSIITIKASELGSGMGSGMSDSIVPLKTVSPRPLARSITLILACGKSLSRRDVGIG